MNESTRRSHQDCPFQYVGLPEIEFPKPFESSSPLEFSPESFSVPEPYPPDTLGLLEIILNPQTTNNDLALGYDDDLEPLSASEAPLAHPHTPNALSSDEPSDAQPLFQQRMPSQLSSTATSSGTPVSSVPGADGRASSDLSPPTSQDAATSLSLFCLQCPQDKPYQPFGTQRDYK